MSDDQQQGGLTPHYQSYARQKCMIAYSEQAAWRDDLLDTCEKVLGRPEFDLEPDYARKHFAPDATLRQKALELVANARCGIYDLSYWQDEQGMWHMPRNVLIELGMAVALNRPTLLLRHKSNHGLVLPECLQSVGGNILEFSGAATLKRALAERLPQWIATPPEHDWWNRFCAFGGRICPYREAHPRARQWSRKGLGCHISDGPDPNRDDFRDVVEEELKRYGDLDYAYLDALPLPDGYGFALCSHCQAVRSTPFAIYRVTPHTPAETFIAIGMSIALEQQFEYTIPKVLLVDRVEDVPSLLAGYEVMVARSDKDRKAHLRTFIPGVLQKVHETTWKPHLLPFIEPMPIIELESDGLLLPVIELKSEGGPRILIIDHSPSVCELLRINLEYEAYEVVTSTSGQEALRRFDLEHFDLIILETIMPDLDGYQAIKHFRKRSNIPILILSARAQRLDVEIGINSGADGYIIKPFNIYELLARVQALLPRNATSGLLTVGNGEITINIRTREVRVRGESVELTLTEYDVLLLLAKNAGNVLSHEVILGTVWGQEYIRDNTYLPVYVSRLRRRIEINPRDPRLLMTYRGIGYSLVP